MRIKLDDENKRVAIDSNTFPISVLWKCNTFIRLPWHLFWRGIRLMSWYCDSSGVTDAEGRGAWHLDYPERGRVLCFYKKCFLHNDALGWCALSRANSSNAV